ncbi:MAG: RNA polymerase sigma-70 factor [Cellulophaga sp.]
MTEQELLKKLRKGDTLAYKYLFLEYYNWLCNYVYKLSCDYTLSEDVVQEIMINLWEKRRTIVITSSLKSYLFRACHNQFLMHIRKEKVRQESLDKIRWDVLFDVTVDDLNSYDVKVAKLNSLIDKLPPRCKEIFVKNKFEKRKYKEIAVDMGISIKTVEAQMSKALQFLRDNSSAFML